MTVESDLRGEAEEIFRPSTSNRGSFTEESGAVGPPEKGTVESQGGGGEWSQETVADEECFRLAGAETCDET